jgi:multiple sugar transport system substrate-binding protein
MKTIPAKEYEAKIMTLLAGGVEMDAYMNKRGTDIFPMVENGYATPLDELAAAAGFDVSPFEGYSKAIRIDGELYVMPFRGEAYFTYYNKKVFEKAGIPTPETYVENGEWTWDKFVEVAKQLATGDGAVYGGILYIWGSQQVFPADQRGIEYITDDGEVDIDDSLAYSFAMRKELEDANAIIPLAELKATKTHYSKAFWAGNAGMLVIGGWFPGMMLSARDDGSLQGFTWNDWSLTRMPCNEEEYVTVGSPTGNVIHIDSEKKEAAFKFISWMAGAEGAVVVAQNGLMSAMFTPEVQEVFSSVLPDETAVKYYTETKKNMIPRFNSYGSKAEAETSKMMEEYLAGDIAPEQVDAIATERFQEVVNMTD